MQQTDGNKVAFRIMEGSKVGTFFQFFFSQSLLSFKKIKEIAKIPAKKRK